MELTHRYTSEDDSRTARSTACNSAIDCYIPATYCSPMSECTIEMIDYCISVVLDYYKILRDYILRGCYYHSGSTYFDRSDGNFDNREEDKIPVAWN